ncbi:MAG TPA: GNAT family N-acetyltransferase [Verrucomicrobiae bacterium]|nr:GNAT family N-acetyltransferase [Verrucomicrobiae bacterium]
MKIRKAKPADAATIAMFNRNLAWETEKLKLNRSLVGRGVRALLKDPGKGIYFVAEQDGQVIGQLMITYEWSDWRNGNIWWIQSVYVASEFRQRRVFRRLFKHVKKLGRSRRDVCGLRLYVEKNNHRAHRAYERLGMKHTHYEIYETAFRGRSIES